MVSAGIGEVRKAAGIAMSHSGHGRHAGRQSHSSL